MRDYSLMPSEHENFIRHAYHTEADSSEPDTAVPSSAHEQGSESFGPDTETSHAQREFMEEAYGADGNQPITDTNALAEITRKEKIEREQQKQFLIATVREALRAEHKGGLLMKKLIEAKRTDLFMPIRQATVSVEGIFDPEDRMTAIGQMKEQGLVSRELQEILTEALTQDSIETIRFLGSIARKRIETKKQSLGSAEMTRETLRETAQEIYEAFIGHAERLKGQHQAKSIPRETLRAFQQEVRSLDRIVFEHIRTRLGGFALGEIEQGSSLQDENGIITEATEVMRILYGTQDGHNLANTCGLYEAMCRNRGVGEKGVFSMRVEGVPLFTLKAMEEIIFAFRRWTHEKPAMDRVQLHTAARQYLVPLETSVSRAERREEVKGALAQAKQSDAIEAQLTIAVRQILDIQRDLAEDTSEESMANLLRDNLRKAKQAVREQAERIAIAPETRTLHDVETLEKLILDALQRDETARAIVREIRTTKSLPKGFFDLYPAIMAGDEERYSPFAFDRLLENYRQELADAVRDAHNGNKEADMRELREMQSVLQRLADTERYTFGQRLDTAHEEAIIDREEYDAFRTFLAASRDAAELDVKKTGEQADDVEAFGQQRGLSKKHRGVAAQRASRARERQSRLEKRVRNFDRGVV